MIVAAPAKVNLWLTVLAREASGYHQLETLFCALDLADELEIVAGLDAGSGERRGLRLEVTGAALGPIEENLVHRAARAFFHELGEPPNAEITLRKRIPAGAGLGGGSSDAAATLRALNALYGDRLPRATLLHLGAELGADVPFFLSVAPLALAWGRGERLLPLPPLPPAPALLAVPDFPSPTAEAYRLLAASRVSRSLAPRALELRRLAAWEAIASLAWNDFEPPLFDRYPALAALKDGLLGSRPLLALLAGSGSALCAIYDDEARRDAAADTLPARFPNVQFLTTATAATAPPGRFGARPSG